VWSLHGANGTHAPRPVDQEWNHEQEKLELPECMEESHVPLLLRAEHAMLTHAQLIALFQVGLNGEYVTEHAMEVNP